MASLTGIIVFIAAVNGAVDQKLTVILTGDDEPIFKYNYGLSFFGAVVSFLLQEFNGICNIYWYIDYYRKYRFASESASETSANQMPKLPYRKKIEIIKEKEPLSKKLNAKKSFTKKRASVSNDAKIAKMNKQETSNFIISSLNGVSTLKRPLEKSNSQDSVLLNSGEMENAKKLSKSNADMTQSNFKNDFSSSSSSNRHGFKKDFSISQNFPGYSLIKNPGLPYPQAQKTLVKVLNPYYSNENSFQAWVRITFAS